MTEHLIPVEKRVLYEDNHIIIINKLPSEIVQGDKTGDTPLSETVKQYIKKKYDKPGEVFLGVVHRLDRPVSGAVIFARTTKALSRLNNMIKDREIKKKYWAIVKQAPEATEDNLIHYMIRYPEKNKSVAYRKERKNSKRAELNYKFLSSSKTFSLLEVELLTGRHHQIRAQLSAIGSPIKGDLKYGFPRSNKDASISLHAVSLEFIHPVSKEKVAVTAKPPQDNVWDYFAENHLSQ
ncbi:MAG: RluA family pseudouridine synthase [Hyphomicrobiales bacterium]